MTSLSKIEGTDLEVFCVARAYSDVLQVTVNCHHAGDTSRCATFGCWARAVANGLELPTMELGAEGSGRPSVKDATTTFDAETLLGGGNVVGSESAQLLARVLCERVLPVRRSSGASPEVLLSLSLPADLHTLDMKLLRSIAAVVTETIVGKRE